MLKRIILGVAFAGLIGLLLVGAVVRTMDRVGPGQGHGVEQGISGGQGHAASPGQGSGEPQAGGGGWVMLQGSVVSADANALVVRATGDELVRVESRAWLFAREQGFSAQAGDQVTLSGLYAGDHFEVGQITNLTTGQAVRLRDENGRPLWAGQRRGGG